MSPKIQLTGRGITSLRNHHKCKYIVYPHQWCRTEDTMRVIYCKKGLPVVKCDVEQKAKITKVWEDRIKKG